MPSQTATPLSVFVDDTDSAIEYEGRWWSYHGLSKDLSSLDYPHDLRSPWYGTVRTSLLSNTRLSYAFNGTAFTAFFLNGRTTSVKSCTVDGRPQVIQETLSGFICTSSKSIFPGKHNLTILFNDEAIVQFDGLLYTPSPAHFPPSGVDLSYHGDIPGGNPDRLWVNTTTNSAVLADPHDCLDVTFNGRSLSVYSHIVFPSTGTTSFQYILDRKQPVNFNITSPLAGMPAPRALLDQQLILQTPPLAPGPHRLRMTLMDTPTLKSDKNVFSIQNVIVQTLPSSVFEINFGSQGYQSGTTTMVQPTSSISILSSSPPNTVTIQPGGPSKTDRSVIVAVAVSISLFLVVQLAIITWFVRRAKRRMDTSLRSNQIEAISPFTITPIVQTGLPPITAPSRVRREKGSRNHGDLGLLPRSIKFNRAANRRHGEQQVGPSTRGADGRAVDTTRENNNDVEVEEVVNLPPVYNTIPLSRPISV